MKIAHSLKAGRQGFALVMVIFFSALAVMALAGVMQWSSNTSQLNERSNRLGQAIGAAEAATEKVITQLAYDFRVNDEPMVYSRLSRYSSMVPSTTESTEWNNYTFSDAQGSSTRTYVTRVSSNGFASVAQYAGLSGFSSTYRVISNVREGAGSGPAITAAVQQEIQLITIPIFQFAIFYSGDMEFIGSATMNISGPVHGNGNMYTGGGSPVTFSGEVTTTGIITNSGGYLWGATATTTYNGGSATNTASLTLPIGTNNSASAVHEILDPPPTGEDPASQMGRERFFNKAELVIQMTNTGLTGFVKTSGTSTGTTISASELAKFINTSNTFTDQREGKVVQVADFDVAKFNTWAATNSTITTTLGASNTVPNIVYYTDRRTLGGGQMGAIRLINGSTLSSRGLTVSTPNPLYVKGVFNQPNATYLNTTNTADAKPAALISDAFTILSPSWNDSLSSTPLGITATPTTINAAILTGNVPSQDPVNKTGSYSGGVMNLPRLLEAWSGQSYSLNGALVCLFTSTNATQPFQMPGAYYNAPSRRISFDNNFQNQNKLPPGTPGLRMLSRTRWSTPPINTLNYAGY